MLPTAALSLVFIASWSRYFRESLEEVLTDLDQLVFTNKVANVRVLDSLAITTDDFFNLRLLILQRLPQRFQLQVGRTYCVNRV